MIKRLINKLRLEYLVRKGDPPVVFCVVSNNKMPLDIDKISRIATPDKFVIVKDVKYKLNYVAVSAIWMLKYDISLPFNTKIRSDLPDAVKFLLLNKQNIDYKAINHAAFNYLQKKFRCFDMLRDSADRFKGIIEVSELPVYDKFVDYIVNKDPLSNNYIYYNLRKTDAGYAADAYEYSGNGLLAPFILIYDDKNDKFIWDTLYEFELQKSDFTSKEIMQEVEHVKKLLKNANFGPDAVKNSENIIALHAKKQFNYMQKQYSLWYFYGKVLHPDCKYHGITGYVLHDLKENTYREYFNDNPHVLKHLYKEVYDKEIYDKKIWIVSKSD